jgi:outer membrane lipoprotein-sorting protein
MKLLLVVVLLLKSSFTFPQPVSSKDIITRMLSATDQIETLRFKFKKIERVNGKMQTGEQDIKYLHSPRKTYAYLHSPSKGTQVLWIANANNGKVLVKPTSFPYMSVNLSPFGSIIRKNNHHTVHQIGFDYVSGIVRSIADKSQHEFDNIFLYQGEVTFNNRDCYKVLIDYTPYQYVNYTVQPKENLTSIADKLYISDYMIMQLNPEIDDYDDVKPGQKIKVPNAYAKKTVLYIDKENYLPIVQKMYDEKGLFSQYEFYDLQLNQPISDKEFRKDYEDYDF